MTIEIRELVIRASVVSNTENTTLSGQMLEDIKKQIVEECRDRILEELSLTPTR